MSRLIKSCITLLSVICLTVSCTEPQLNNHQAVVIGLDSDVTTLNPLYVSREAEANISELIYLALVGYDWDSEKGEVISYPLLAKKIEWNGDSSSVLITIRDDIKSLPMILYIHLICTPTPKSRADFMEFLTTII